MATVSTLPTQVELLQRWGGKDIADLPKPAAVIDRAIVRGHCERMNNTIRTLGVEFRAHVKTHKVSVFYPDETALAAMQRKLENKKLTPT
jgi:D-serine deaminase-like pyridoxal phosphate-dependent protein